jgi:hypothetical protein
MWLYIDAGKAKKKYGSIAEAIESKKRRSG